MKVTQIIVDEVPDKCEYCWFCIFDGEHSADWCFAVDRHVLENGRPTYCPLVKEGQRTKWIIERCEVER